MRENAGLFILGGLGGALVAWGIWTFASAKLDQQLAQGGSQLGTQLGAGRTELTARLSAGETQLRQQIRTAVANEVPPQVRATIEQKFRDYGLTPQTGQQISSLLTVAQGAGLL